MENETNYKEVVNPTFYTAQSTVELLAASGNDDAAKLVELLGIRRANFRYNKKTTEQNFSQDEIVALRSSMNTAIEAGYDCVNYLFKKSGYKNMFDIGCGYTPRGLDVTRAGCNYVGLDVPVVVEKMSALPKELVGNANYIAGDATNIVSMKKGADSLDGEIFISSEGLLGYLSKTELKQMLAGIRNVLLAHGGAWYSSDIEVKYQKFPVITIDKPDILERWKKNMAMLQSESNIYFTSSTFDDFDKTEKLFESCGFKVEKLPFYYDEIQMNNLKKFTPEIRSKLVDYMKTISIWKMTAVGSIEDVDDVQCKSTENLKIEYEVNDKTLYFSLDGRLDTLSSPEFLEIFDSCKKDITAVSIDMKDLEYISSSGLRVLIMFVKALGKANVVAKNINETVGEVFSSTGFNDIITM